MSQEDKGTKYKSSLALQSSAIPVNRLNEASSASGGTINWVASPPECESYPSLMGGDLAGKFERLTVTTLKSLGTTC